LWYAYYKGWFAGRAGRRHPQVHSMVEHAYMVDGYDTGRHSAQGLSNRMSKTAPAGQHGAAVTGRTPSAAESTKDEE
jgi:hypothetical protein